MKRSLLFVSCLWVVAAQLPAQGPDTSLATSGNPLRIAMLRWYQGSGNGSAVALPAAASSMVFDGTDVWVGTSAGLVQMRPGDGRVLATYNIPGICQLAFDGLNLWSVDCDTGMLSKIRASTGTVVGKFAIGTQLVGLAYDGAYIWVSNQSAQGTVTKVRAADGAPMGTFPVGSEPSTIAFDGQNIWVVNRASSSVSKLRASDGALLGTFPTGNNPQGIAFDGQNMWVTNIIPPTGVTKIQVSDGSSLGFFALPGNPFAVVFDGQSIWIGGSRTFKLDPSSAAILASFEPTGVMVFDGASIWVGNQPSNSLSRL